MHQKLWLAIVVCGVTALTAAEERSVNSGLLLVPVQRQLQQQAQAAENLLAHGETAQALPILEQLWRNSSTALVGNDVVLESLRDHILLLMKRVPEIEQTRFWERIEAASGDRFSEDVRGAPTRTGLGLLWRTAVELRDHGEFELAAAAFHQALQHPAITPRESLLAELQELELLALVHGPDILTHWLASTDAAKKEQMIRLGEETRTLADWLQQRRLQLASASSETVIAADRPALTPLWQETIECPPELVASLRTTANELRAEGVSRLSAIPPRIIGNRVVVHTPIGLDCRDIATGKLLWTLADRLSGERAALMAQQQNPIFRHKLQSGLMQRLQANTRWGAMSHDDATIYRLVEVEAATEPQNAAVDYALEAVDLASGRPRWRVGGTRKSQSELSRELQWPRSGAAPNPESPAISLSGPPLVIGQHMFFLCEVKNELRFVSAQKETLQVEWWVEVGQFLPNSDRSLPKLFTGCSPVWTGTSMICPTGSGVIFAADPIQHRLKWIARMPVDDVARVQTDSTFGDIAAAKSALQSWRGVSLLVTDGKLICGTPESSRIHVLDIATGRMLYSVPRSQGLKLLGVSGEYFLVLEPTAIRAHRMANGELSWRSVIGETRGQGLIAGEHVVQPLASGGLAIIDAESGQAMPTAIRSNLSWGHLLRTSQGWLSAEEFQIALHPDLKQWMSTFTAETPVGERVQAAYESGDFTAARQLLADVGGEADRKLRFEIDQSELHFSPSQMDLLRDSLQNNASDQVAQVALAEAALQQDRSADAVKFALSGLDLGVTGFREIRDEEQVRVVRWDRVFSGLITAAQRRADAQQRSEIENLLAAHWHTAKTSGDPFALQQLYQRARGIRWTRKELVSETEAVFLGSRLVSRDLSLRESASSDPVPAWWKLRQEWQAAGFPSDAEDIDFHLWCGFPGALVEGEQTVRQQFAQSQAIVDRLQHRFHSGPEETWPSSTPRVTETKDFYDDANQTIIPITADPDGVWDRLDVILDRQGRTLRFAGDGRPGSWTLATPRNTSPLPWTDRGWGIGRVLLLRIGTRLLAVTPFDEQGAAVASLLWMIDLQGPGAIQTQGYLGTRMLPRWKRASEDEYRFRDQFGRDFAPVGPVRPGYLCVQRQGKLLAVETLTGQTLWEHWDLAPGTTAWGDDEQVFLWSADEKTIEVLDAADGRTLRRQHCDFSLQDLWHEAGGSIWIGQQTAQLTLRRINLIDNAVVWERSFPQGSLPVVLDERNAAVIDARGLLHFLDLMTGELLDEALTIEMPQVIDRVLLSRDESRWYLGISASSPRSLDWQQAQPLHGFRRPLLNGPLYAISRVNRRIVWKRDIEGEPWLLDQNRSSPVLVQIYKMPPPNGQGIGEGVLQLIEKRTGRPVFTHRDFNLLANYLLEPNAPQQQFELRTERTSFQFDYQPENND